jgi:hypothetical protein
LRSVGKNSEPIRIGGTEIRVLTLEALILAKRAMGRPKDLHAVLELAVIRERRRRSWENLEKFTARSSYSISRLLFAAFRQVLCVHSRFFSAKPLPPRRTSSCQTLLRKRKNLFFADFSPA